MLYNRLLVIMFQESAKLRPLRTLEPYPSLIRVLRACTIINKRLSLVLLQIPLRLLAPVLKSLI